LIEILFFMYREINHENLVGWVTIVSRIFYFHEVCYHTGMVRRGIEGRRTGAIEGKRNEIPSVLREFGEIPEGCASAWIVVSKERLKEISTTGIQRGRNIRAGRNQRLEELFQEEADELGITVSRTDCVFATPLPPEQMRCGYSGLYQESVVLEVKVGQARDTEILVADGEAYTEAASWLQEGHYDEEEAREWANQYWSTARPLQTYLAEQRIMEAEAIIENPYSFVIPELLIPQDISRDYLKIWESK
jgi:hypothetical protein